MLFENVLDVNAKRKEDGEARMSGVVEASFFGCIVEFNFDLTRSSAAGPL